MHRPLTTKIAAAAIAGLALVGTVGVLPASAKAGDVRVAGSCNGPVTTKLKLGVRDGGIEAEVETDSNRVGQLWTVRMRQNGVLVHSGTARTTAPSGSFEVEKRLRNQPGTDTITAVSRHAATGVTCTVTARI